VENPTIIITPPEATPDDKGKSKTGSFDKSVKKASDAGVELLAGMAQAFASGLRALSAEVTPKNATRVGFDNGLMKGVAEGSARAFEEAPKVIRRTMDILLADDRDEG